MRVKREKKREFRPGRKECRRKNWPEEWQNWGGEESEWWRMQGGEKRQSRETDETDGWIRERVREKAGGEDRVSEGREWGRGDEQKDKRRPALWSGPQSIGIHPQHRRENLSLYSPPVLITSFYPFSFLPLHPTPSSTLMFLYHPTVLIIDVQW